METSDSQTFGCKLSERWLCTFCSDCDGLLFIGIRLYRTACFGKLARRWPTALSSTHTFQVQVAT